MAVTFSSSSGGPDCTRSKKRYMSIFFLAGGGGSESLEATSPQGSKRQRQRGATRGGRSKIWKIGATSFMDGPLARFAQH